MNTVEVIPSHVQGNGRATPWSPVGWDGSELYFPRRTAMNDITILDLFWLILKFLAALGLVGLVGFVLFWVWAAGKRATRTAWDILRGRHVSVTATVCFTIAVCVLVYGMVAGVWYLRDHAPPHATNSTSAPGGPYSAYPCDGTQTVSPIDGKPCKEKNVAPPAEPAH
jgi:hypothetical protein